MSDDHLKRDSMFLEEAPVSNQCMIRCILTGILTPLTRLRDGLEKMRFSAVLKALAFPCC
jgi:hypothetical protein